MLTIREISNGEARMRKHILSDATTHTLVKYLYIYRVSHGPIELARLSSLLPFSPFSSLPSGAAAVEVGVGWTAIVAS